MHKLIAKNKMPTAKCQILIRVYWTKNRDWLRRLAHVDMKMSSLWISRTKPDIVKPIRPALIWMRLNTA